MNRRSLLKALSALALMSVVLKAAPPAIAKYSPAEINEEMRQFLSWKSASTELVALAPKTPFIGPAGMFNR